MRRLLFLLALVLAACGGDGDDFRAAPELLQHAPEISDLKLTPDTAMYMEGEGSIRVTAEFGFTDVAQDMQTLHIEISDGTDLAIELSEPINTVSGTLTEEFDISTASVGTFTVEIWLVDRAGQSSNHLSANVQVIGDTPDTSAWLQRESGLPYVLNDVLWDGDNFVAVGDGGAILTSDDGIDWAERESGTDVDLNAVAVHGSDIVAVGYDTTVLLSIDNGESWSIKHVGSRIRLAAVVLNASQIIAGGMDQQRGDAFIMRSTDRGENWTVLESLPQTEHFVADLVYANGLFVAATDYFDSRNDARVMLSVDGEIWQEVILRDEGAASYAILHDGTQFIAAGSDSTIFASADGYYWTESPTPIDRVTYLSVAWSGSKLVAAGGITWWYWWGGTIPTWERDVGISSTDGGATWEAFNINGHYQSRGMAWGYGRFVSVGQSTPISGEGAIYTSN